ncbi:response regulator [Ostreibacterium oceani]|uniref:Response regulator n=1 Tax=Ostreibacterium oceani TaxID=2654998 RepID=A0A6N7EWL4_9GAMM|nr:response regulator [Ostreibacterium oceani]MPV86303.1 response regulator [Ostreibacterium oceani]
MAINKVLIVDDSRLARLTLSRLLNEKGMATLEAESVDDALAVLSQNTVDAIFMDVMMPERSGFEGVEQIKSDPKLNHIPCAMYSGDLSVDAQRKAIESGAQAYLFKPASGEGLDHVLAALNAGIIADSMQKYSNTAALSAEKSADSTMTSSEHTEMIGLLENRTKNLARIVMKERKENESIKREMEQKIAALFQELQAVENQKLAHSQEELERKRIENDLRGQLKNTRGDLKLIGLVAFAAGVVALVSLFFVVYLALKT